MQIATKAQGNSALGRCWAEAPGWSVVDDGPEVTGIEPPGFTYPGPVALCVDVLRVPEAEAGKNRGHNAISPPPPPPTRRV